MKHLLHSFQLFAACLIIFSQFPLQAQNALNFDGTNDNVQTTFDGVTGTTNRTFEAWILVGNGLSSNNCIMDYGQNAVGSRNTFSVGGSYELRFISGGTNANITSSTNAVTSGQWTHVAFVLDNGTGYIYANGVQVGTGNLSNVNTPSTGTDLRLGQRVPGGSIPFEGSIDEVRIWNVARSATEIMNSMNGEFCSVPTGLVAYYKLNEGIAGGTNTGITSTADASGNANNGTLNNFALTGSTSNWVTGVPLSTGTLTGSVSVTGCDGSYTSPSGTVYTQSGTYMDTIVTTTGCDSILTITLNFNSSSSSYLIATECYSYASPSGSNTWTTSGIYQDTIANAAGCDSVITIDLSINASYDTINATGCGSYTSPSGNNTWFNTGTYFDTLTNNAGCDSNLFIFLQMENDAQTNITESACISYTSPSGLYTWTASGTYQDTLVASTGCDSVLTIDLDVTEVDTQVTVTGQSLNAAAIGAGITYQWINCATGNAVSGATQKIFAPSNSGNYAVVVTNEGCSDTSACNNVTVVGLSDISSQGLNIYPNPSDGRLVIQMNDASERLHISVYDVRGQLLQQHSFSGSGQREFVLPEASGIYLLEAEQNGARWRTQVVRK